MIVRTFIDKCTTIFENSHENFGLYPVGMLNYGDRYSMSLIHFNLDKIKSNVDDIEEGTNIKHVLKLTNCSSIEVNRFYKNAERAVSFTVMAFKCPSRWDAGIGFDEKADFFGVGKASVSEDGCNWFQAYNGFPWILLNDESGDTYDNGIYSKEYLEGEYVKYLKGEESIIVAHQHFDYGNENFELDITSYVNDCLNGDDNFGLCLSFTPEFRDIKGTQRYVGFFNNNTNTFFHPFIETVIDSKIEDARKNFVSGFSNKLYLYTSVDNDFIELDEMPVCIIDDKEYEVRMQRKGIYYAIVDDITAKTETVKYDTWTNLFYEGNPLDDCEMSFVVKPKEIVFNFNAPQQTEAVPRVYGINDNEELNYNERRIITVTFSKPYSGSLERVKNSYYRIYTKDGKRELDVIDWDVIDNVDGSSVFTIDTESLMPAKYYVDIKTIVGTEARVYKNKLHFSVADNITDRKM